VPRVSCDDKQPPHAKEADNRKREEH